MKLTKVMKARAKFLYNKWKDEGEGYGSIVGSCYSVLVYISLPKGHKAIDKDDENYNPDVNGGLTFSDGNVFGWDYGHFQNDMNVEEHIKNAIKYFKAL